MARALIVKACKKRKFEASLVINLQLKIEDNKLSMADINDTKNEFKTWFWNNSTNESKSDIVEEKDGNENESDLEIEKSREISLEICKKIKYNKEGENKFCKVYEIELKAMSKR